MKYVYEDKTKESTERQRDLQHILCSHKKFQYNSLICQLI
jgi:hypothetical protein